MSIGRKMLEMVKMRVREPTAKNTKIISIHSWYRILGELLRKGNGYGRFSLYCLGLCRGRFLTRMTVILDIHLLLLFRLPITLHWSISIQ
jgi:hypothetical protein